MHQPDLIRIINVIAVSCIIRIIPEPIWITNFHCVDTHVTQLIKFMMDLIDQIQNQRSGHQAHPVQLKHPVIIIAPVEKILFSCCTSKVVKDDHYLQFNQVTRTLHTIRIINVVVVSCFRNKRLNHKDHIITSIV